MPNSSPDNLVLLGRIGAVYGIKGWVKIQSYTEPKEGILSYPLWWIRSGNQAWQPVKLVDGRVHGKGLVASLEGCNDRNRAQSYCGAEIAVDKDLLPVLDEDDYYWHQLEGLKVVAVSGGNPVLLGRVDHIMATGANDVLVVRACEGSVDQRERLIPYLQQRVVKRIDLEVGEIQVDWDPEF